MRFSRGKLELIQPGRATMVVSYFLNQKTSPPGINWFIPRPSPIPSQHGLYYWFQRGIYWLEEDTLMICLGAVDAPPATEFLTQPTDGQTLFILERLNAPDKEPSPSDAQRVPLGTFLLRKADQPDGSMLVRLMVNQEGGVIGQAYDLLTKTEQPLEGSVDKNTKRIRWSVGADKVIVMETGLASVTTNDSSVQVRRANGASETWAMTRVFDRSSQ
jgi:hypothetical protein